MKAVVVSSSFTGRVEKESLVVVGAQRARPATAASSAIAIDFRRGYFISQQVFISKLEATHDKQEANSEFYL